MNAIATQCFGLDPDAQQLGLVRRCEKLVMVSALGSLVMFQQWTGEWKIERMKFTPEGEKTLDIKPNAR